MCLVGLSVGLVCVRARLLLVSPVHTVKLFNVSRSQRKEKDAQDQADSESDSTVGCRVHSGKESVLHKWHKLTLHSITNLGGRQSKSDRGG